MSGNTTAPGLALRDWKALQRNSLRGFATVEIQALGLVVSDVPVHVSDGRAWAVLPSKPVMGSDGVALRDRNSGKVRYVSILSWRDKAIADRFSAAVVAAVEAAHPGAVQ